MKKTIILHPILLAIYPIIFLYSHNVQEVLLNQILIPIGIALLATAILWALLYLAIKNNFKASLITSTVIIAFFSYGYIFENIKKIDFMDLKHWHMLPLTLLLLGYIIYFICISKNQKTVENISKVLNIVAITLVAINLIIIIPSEVNKYNLSSENNVSQKTKEKGYSDANYPDIYYIILDEYASSSTIKKIWNYDNSNFTNSLKEKGFYIAENSRTRYHNSIWSIASSLNMEYVGGEISPAEFYEAFKNNEVGDYKNISTSELYKKLRENKVSSYLKLKGYKIVVFDNYYSINPSKGLMKADVQYNYNFDNNVSFIDAFSVMLINSTMLKPFGYIFTLDYTNVDDVHKNATLYTLNKLKGTSSISGPKFVFAHIICPHTPFFFNREGAEVDQINMYNWKDRKYYLDQYIFISNQIEKVVSEILNKSSDPPIIIIQSDHGPRPFNSPVKEENLEIPIDDMFKIFNSYYLPGSNKFLYDDIAPVNTFRLIFNKYFNDKFELLEEK